ncbi:MAG TPA: type II secretion system F family protein [Candidatus Dormibacteraeota bacterium]|nr:type II secretion system F family protein [Candidatus Dormibacteraeota bacterium]
MSGYVVLAVIGGAGVLLAAIAAAIPAPQTKAAATSPPWAAVAAIPQPNLRDRINKPFQALADRTRRSQRLNRGLSLAENLARADLKLRTTEFVMIQLAFLVVGALFALWRFGFQPEFVIAAVGAYLIPMRYVRWRQRRRLKKFNSHLPDMLSLLANAMKAGLSLPQALEAVTQNTSPPMSDELTRVMREVKIGSPTPTALANMVRRVGSEDFDLIVTAISIQASVGGNLARILDSIGHTIRQRVQMKAQVGAMTAQMRASGWIITLLPFIVAGILEVITPSYFRIMFTDPGGHVLLGMAVVSIVVGNYFVRRITNFRI